MGLFGSGILLGNDENCRLSGIFGPCQQISKENAANIVHLQEYSRLLAINVQEFKANTDEKFDLISSELSEINRVQQEIVKIQESNWENIPSQMETMSKIVRILRDCTRFLFSRQQINFNYDTLASLMNMMFTNVKAYGTALYTYQLNSKRYTDSYQHRMLAMSLVTRASLMAILGAEQA